MLTVDWNMVDANGRVPALTKTRRAFHLGDFVVADDGEGTAFLCIVAGTGRTDTPADRRHRTGVSVILLRPTDRIHKEDVS